MEDYVGNFDDHDNIDDQDDGKWDGFENDLMVIYKWIRYNYQVCVLTILPFLEHLAQLTSTPPILN